MLSSFSRHKASMPYSNSGFIHAESTENALPLESMSGLPDEKEFCKAAPQVNVRALDGADTDETHGRHGRTWQAGILARFPFLSLACLMVILGCMLGIVIVLLKSDGKSVNLWDSTDYEWRGKERRLRLGVSTWISLLNFFMTKALAAMFAEAVAVSWWVEAMQGQTLGSLHARWEVGQSFLKIFTRRRTWGWICIASLAAVAFSAFDALLQEASSSRIGSTSGPIIMLANFPSSIPAGFSGVEGSVDEWVGTVYPTPIFNDVVQNYTSQAPIKFDASGCSAGISGSCTVTFPGIGFEYMCTATRRAPAFYKVMSVDPQEQSSTYFAVKVHSASLPNDFNEGETVWSIEVDATWKDQTPAVGNVMAHRTCILKPALVEYPMNITGGIATLTAPTSSVSWTEGSIQTSKDSLVVDKVLHTLPQLKYDKNDTGYQTTGAFVTHSTLGGIAQAFSNIFDSSIKVDSNSDVVVQGSLASQFATFPNGDLAGHASQNTFSSPMESILSSIREIMFRSSVAIAQNDVRSYTFRGGKDGLEQTSGTSIVSSTAATGTFHNFESVYKTNHALLTIAMALMLLCLAAIMPLYAGFWKLGRKVSLSPFEIAKALHHSQRDDMEAGIPSGGSVLDTRGIAGCPPQAGSNCPDDELIEILGHTRIRYGEVAPSTLGIGLYDRTMKPRGGATYR